MGNGVCEVQRLRVCENLYVQESPVSDQSFILLKVYCMNLGMAVSCMRNLQVCRVRAASPWMAQPAPLPKVLAAFHCLSLFVVSYLP